MDDSIGFVILHYQQIQETINCVNSVVEKVKNYRIVVIDNCSPNESGKKLDSMYDDAKKINVLLLEKNYGFAHANNVGFQILKEQGCQFICCINNDTEIVQNDFFERIKSEYKKSHFAVLGPLVRVRDNSIQGFASTIKSLADYEKELSIYETSSTLDKYLECLGLVTRAYLRHPSIMGKIRKIKQIFNCPYKNRMENVILHGCFLVFSEKYIYRFDTAFQEGTFMYREEELLYLRLKENNLLSVYCNDINVKHLEKAATNSNYANAEERYRFVRQCQIDSLRILIEKLKESGK